MLHYFSMCIVYISLYIFLYIPIDKLLLLSYQFDFVILETFLVVFVQLLLAKSFGCFRCSVRSWLLATIEIRQILPPVKYKTENIMDAFLSIHPQTRHNTQWYLMQCFAEASVIIDLLRINPLPFHYTKYDLASLKFSLYRIILLQSCSGISCFLSFFSCFLPEFVLNMLLDLFERQSKAEFTLIIVIVIVFIRTTLV